MKVDLYQLYQLMLKEMGPTNWWPAESKEQILVEAILIQNTTESNAIRASHNIAEATNYNLQKLLALETEVLQELVRPSGFMKNKAKSLQSVAAWVIEQGQDWEAINQRYGNNLRERLLSLFGVGDETADVYLAYLFDQPAFVADKYARTLFWHLGVEHLTDYKSLHKELSILPAPFTYQDAQEFHGLIDEFGKAYFGRSKQFSQSFLANKRLEF